MTIPRTCFYSQGAFLGLEPRSDTRVLSLVNPGSEFPLPKGWGPSLQLAFWDVTDEAKLLPRERAARALDQWGARRLSNLALPNSGSWPSRPPMARDADAVVEFIQNSRASGSHLAIHCEFGKSRSGACALAAAASGYFLDCAPPERPNPLLLKLLARRIPNLFAAKTLSSAP